MYLRNTGRDEQRVALVEAMQRKWFLEGADYAPVFTDTLHLDMSTIASDFWKKTADFVALDQAQSAFTLKWRKPSRPMGRMLRLGRNYVEFGKVVIASNTLYEYLSHVMLSRLVARKRPRLG